MENLRQSTNLLLGKVQSLKKLNESLDKQTQQQKRNQPQNSPMKLQNKSQPQQQRKRTPRPAGKAS